MARASNLFAELRCLLNMPSHADSQWRLLTDSQRIGLIIMAGLPAELSALDWTAMTRIEQQKILIEAESLAQFHQQVKAII